MSRFLWITTALIAAILAITTANSRAVRADGGEDPLSIQPELLAAAPAVPDFTIQDPPPVLWTDPAYPERDLWTQYMYEVINTTFDQLDQATDMKYFCPKYPKLTRDQQIETWAMFFSAVSYWESSFDPTNDTLETGPSAGTDPVTGEAVHSDGLLQLSYQDGIVDTNPGDQKGVANAGTFCKFDWADDQKLDPNDVHRSILNPYNNLYCGIHIMATQIATPPHQIILGDAAYWSTLQKGNVIENRTHEIQNQMSKYKFCGVHENLLADFIYDLMRFIRGLRE